MIQGKTIDLKPLEKSDIEQLREWRNSKDVADFMLSREMISREQQEKWFQKIQTDPSCIYWVIVSKNGEKMGLANFISIDHATQSAEPGLYIGNKENRNAFFGMEAYYYLLHYGFTQLGLEKIYGTVLSGNSTALKMNAAFGFETVSVQKAAVSVNGIGQDVYKIQLHKDAFYRSKMARFFNNSR